MAKSVSDLVNAQVLLDFTIRLIGNPLRTSELRLLCEKGEE